MQEEIDKRDENEEGEEIDLLELFYKLWNKRWTICKWCAVGAVIGLVVAFSIPREYTVDVKLAPELSDNKAASGGLGALASMAGLGGMQSSGSDAVYPQLYPDVVKSVPFLTSLFDVPVETSEDGEKFTVSQFIDEETTGPWWGAVMRFPFTVIGWLMPGDDEEVAANHKLDTFRLTKDENDMVLALADRVTASVDQKTFVVTINVTMQDPLVAAMLADTVVARLQEYVTDYRTNKARKDLEYAEKLNAEAKDEYYKAQQKLADYTDRNQGIATQSARIARDRLDNEAQLAFSLYNTTSQQVQKAKAKVQETTPVYAVVNPATVPIRPSAPRKVMILIGWVFLAFVASASWILFIKPALASTKERRKQLAAMTDDSDTSDADVKSIDKE